MTAHDNPIRLSGLAESASRVAKDRKQHSTIAASKKGDIASSLKYGQKQLLQQLPLYRDKSARILEIGCGKGELLHSIAKQHHKTTLLGIDKDATSVKHAQEATHEFKERVELQQLNFEQADLPESELDIALVSYTLSQTQDWESLLKKIFQATRTNGYIAVVDFHNTKLNAFRKRMAKQQVQMDGTLLPLLRQYYTEHYQKVSSANLGMWEYFVFIGRKDKF